MNNESMLSTRRIKAMHEQENEGNEYLIDGTNTAVTFSTD
jgi:hypothetical protein